MATRDACRCGPGAQPAAPGRAACGRRPGRPARVPDKL